MLVLYWFCCKQRRQIIKQIYAYTVITSSGNQDFESAMLRRGLGKGVQLGTVKISRGLLQLNFHNNGCIYLEKSKAKCQVSFHPQNWLAVLENKAFFVALLRILVKRIQWVFFLPALEKCEKATVFHAVDIKRSAPISSQLTLYCYLKYGLSPVFILNDAHLSC